MWQSTIKLAFYETMRMRKKKKPTLILTLAPLAMGLFLVSHPYPGSEGFLQAVKPRVFSFPKDHGDHPGFRTEWWYYTGNLETAERRPFGFQLTFFRAQLKPVPFVSESKWRSNQLYFAHFTISDIRAQEFLVAEKAGRGAVGIGGVSFHGHRTRLFLHGWEVAIEAKTHHLCAASDQFAIDLRLTPEKPPILHGDEGLSRKGDKEGQASYYYSLTRMSTQGILTVGGQDFKVSGASWMDHEFSSNVLSEDQVGWDWMGLQLSDGRELMLYVLRRKDGSVEPSSSGTLIQKDGTPVHLPQEAFVIQPQDYWKSPQTHGRYPSSWEVEVFPYEISLSILPHMKEQELVTEHSTQVTYWEGGVGVTGMVSGQEVTGSGYVELTGYTHGFNGALLW